MKILVVNGPNINMLGLREAEIYGDETYTQLQERLQAYALMHNIEVDEFQSNHEGAIIDTIQSAYGKYNGIVINPAGYTHTSIAILDALKAISLPTVEVHISKLSKREKYRQISYVSEYASKTIEGQGITGYIEALEYLVKIINK